MRHASPRQRRRRTSSAHPARRPLALLVAFPLAVFLGVFAGAGQAVAAIPEFCGDTVRGLAHHACPSPDADRDGYATDGTGLGYDCDDSNMFIFTGTPSASGCSAGEIKTCQADGTYTACSAPTAKWIDCDAGVNGTGTYASPWNTLQMVAYFYNAGSRPAGWYDIAPADTIFVQGTCSDTYDVEGGYGTWALMLRGGSMSGSSGNLIKFLQWPGETQWVINPGCTAGAPCGNVYLYQADFIEIAGAEITGSYGSSGIFTEESDDVRISRNYIHDIGGSAANNSAGIVTKDTSHARPEIDHNVVLDTYDSQQGSANENNANVTLFKPDSANVHHNVLGYTATTGSSVVASGTCLKFKHGMNPSGTGTSTVTGNVCFNSYISGFRSGQPEVTFANNLVLDSDVGFKIDDAGGTTYAADNVIEYNTVVGSALLKYDPVHRYNSARTDSGTNCGGDVDIGLLTVRFNVTEDDDASYGSNEGFISVGSGTTAAQDALYGDVVTDGMLSIVTNSYYNSAAAGFRAGLYEQNNGTTTCGSGATGNSGAAYSSFANWQAAGWDAGSENADAVLDSDHIATTGDAVDWGWRQAGAGPTPTPSPSPTPTPVPTGTFDIGPTLRNQVRIR